MSSKKKEDKMESLEQLDIDGIKVKLEDLKRSIKELEEIKKKNKKIMKLEEKKKKILGKIKKKHK